MAKEGFRITLLLPTFVIIYIYIYIVSSIRPLMCEPDSIHGNHVEFTLINGLQWDLESGSLPVLLPLSCTDIWVCELFTFGAALLSTRRGCGIHAGCGLSVLSTLTETDIEIWDRYNDAEIKTKGRVKS